MTITKGRTWIIDINGDDQGRPVPHCRYVDVVAVSRLNVTYCPVHPRTGITLLNNRTITGKAVFNASIVDAPVQFPANPDDYIYHVGTNGRSLDPVAGPTPAEAIRRADILAHQIAADAGRCIVADYHGRHLYMVR